MLPPDLFCQSMFLHGGSDVVGTVAAVPVRARQAKQPRRAALAESKSGSDWHGHEGRALTGVLTSRGDAGGDDDAGRPQSICCSLPAPGLRIGSRVAYAETSSLKAPCLLEGMSCAAYR